MTTVVATPYKPLFIRVGALAGSWNFIRKRYIANEEMVIFFTMSTSYTSQNPLHHTAKEKDVLLQIVLSHTAKILESHSLMINRPLIPKFGA